MAKRKRRKTPKPRPTAKTRNPFWRLRRMLGERRTESGKAYRRAAERHKARRPEVSDD